MFRPATLDDLQAMMAVEDAFHPDEPIADVIRRGTDEIFAPVLSSTVTTVVVFAPLGLVEGVVGQFFKAFSIALAVAVGLSLVLAVSVIPIRFVRCTGRTSNANDPSSQARTARSLSRAVSPAATGSTSTICPPSR